MYSKILYNEPKKFNSVVFTLSSATAAISCDLITNPMWVIRLRYQTEYLHSGQNKIDSFNIIKSVHKLYKKVKILNCNSRKAFLRFTGAWVQVC
jgi:hypothetical protein